MGHSIIRGVLEEAERDAQRDTSCTGNVVVDIPHSNSSAVCPAKHTHYTILGCKLYGVVVELTDQEFAPNHLVSHCVVNGHIKLNTICTATE